MFHNVSCYDAHLFNKELGKNFNMDNIGVTAENKEKYISFNVKINVKITGLSDKDGKEVGKNIQLRFIDNCRFMTQAQINWQAIWMIISVSTLKGFTRKRKFLTCGAKSCTHTSI